MTKSAIYVLADRQGKIRYVGKANNPKRRFQQHCAPGTFDETPKAVWLRGLLDAGHVPYMHIVEWTDDWDSAEREWIIRLRAAGADLLNVSEGGAVIWPKGKLRGRQPRSPYRKVMHKTGLFIRDCLNDGNKDMAEKLEYARSMMRKKARRLVREYGKAGMAQLNAEIAGSFGARL